MMELVCNTQGLNTPQSRTSSQTTTARRVDIALFNGFALPDTAAVIEIFQKANAFVVDHPHRRTRYDVSLLSGSGGRIASSSSVFVWTESVDLHRHTNDSHTLFIAGGDGAHQACRDERLMLWLRSACLHSDIVHTIGKGRALFTAAGLENANGLPVFSGNSIWDVSTVHGFGSEASPMQAALNVIEEDLGAELAQQIAKSMSQEDQVQPGANFNGISASAVSDKILASARWLEANVDRPISIDHAAQIAAMSERTFLRRFKNEMGMTPSDYLLRVRLEMSRRMLVETRLPIDKIARRCGVGSGGHLAKLFRKHLSTTPTEFRMLSRLQNERL